MKPIDPKEIEQHKKRYLYGKRIKEKELEEQRLVMLEEIEAKAKSESRNLEKYASSPYGVISINERE